MISPLRYLHRTDGVSTGGHRLGRKEWVLSRSLVRFLRLDLSGIPASKRMAALALELRVRKPYADTRSVVAWQAGWALVFLWDGSNVDAVMAEHLPRGRATMLPESILYAPLASDGARLLRVAEGVEGQAWQQGQLMASRWWPQAPSPTEWDGFVRDAGMAGASLPAVQALPLLDKPWAKVLPVGGGQADVAGIELFCYAALAASLVYGAVDYKLEAHRLETALSATQKAAEQARARAGKLVDSREAATADLDRAGALLSIDQYVDPITLLAEVGELLPSESLSVRNFEYQAGKLKLTLQSSAGPISGSQMVEAMQKRPDLVEPKALIGNDPKLMVFDMGVRSLRGKPKSGAGGGLRLEDIKTDASQVDLDKANPPMPAKPTRPAPVQPGKVKGAKHG